MSIAPRISAELNRTERRDRKAHQRRHGMRVSGGSVRKLVLQRRAK